MRTEGYWYQLNDALEPGREIVAYHWHPDVPGAEFPHIHPLIAGGDARRFHFATPHTTLSHLLTFAVRDLNVAPRREDWRQTLEEVDGLMLATLPVGVEVQYGRSTG